MPRLVYRSALGGDRDRCSRFAPICAAARCPRELKTARLGAQLDLECVFAPMVSALPFLRESAGVSSQRQAMDSTCDSDVQWR